MKLFSTFVAAGAVVKAQDFNDLSSLSDLFASLGGLGGLGGLDGLGDLAGADTAVASETVDAPAVEADVAADDVRGERYLGSAQTQTSTTNTGTTTTNTNTGNNPVVSASAGTELGCWKCDAMSYAQCATEGRFEVCTEYGTNEDQAVCFIEMREQDQKLTQLCTGCKTSQACEDLKKNNFHPAENTAGFSPARNQCKPNHREQRRSKRFGASQSVCRQCFMMCDSGTGTNCFGGLTLAVESAADDTAKREMAHWFAYIETQFPTGTHTTDEAKAMLRAPQLLGIPLGITINTATQFATDVTLINNVANYLYYGTTGTGSYNAATTFDDSKTATTTRLPVFWGLAKQDEAFWTMNIPAVQNSYRTRQTASLTDTNLAFFTDTTTGGTNPVAAADLDHWVPSY